MVNSAPPFALQVCSDRVTADQLTRLDLSGIVALVVGAEPITRTSLLQFAHTFAHVGFNAKTFVPAYGQAESCVHVFSKMTTTYTPICHCFDVDALKQGKLQLTSNESIGRWYVSSGEIQCMRSDYINLGLNDDALVVLIVNPNTFSECVDGEIGELWIYSGSKAKGYWNNTNATESTFNAELQSACSKRGNYAIENKLKFLRSGDLGSILDNQYYIISRLKHMICIGGQNYYAVDIESCVRDSCINIRPGSIVAYSTYIDNNETESLGIAVEVIPRDSAGQPISANQVSRAAHIAQYIFQLTSIMPQSTRVVLISKLARLGRAILNCRRRDNVINESDSDDDTAHVNECGYTDIELDTIIKSIRRSVLSTFTVPVNDIVVCKPHTVLKTSSGKVRREQTRDSIIGAQVNDKILRRSMINKPVKRVTFESPQSINHNNITSSSAPLNQSIRTDPYQRTMKIAEPYIKQQSLCEYKTNETIQRATLSYDYVRSGLVRILADELGMTQTTVDEMSTTFEFDESKSM